MSTEAAKLYTELHARLMAMTDEELESDEAQAIRDQADEPWHAMTEEEKEEFRNRLFNRDEAIASWNTRVSPKTEREPKREIQIVHDHFQGEPTVAIQRHFRREDGKMVRSCHTFHVFPEEVPALIDQLQSFVQWGDLKPESKEK